LRNNFLMWYTSELVRKAEKKGWNEERYSGG
jgi:hypothetical protein